jgi:hypothetical protein
VTEVATPTSENRVKCGQQIHQRPVASTASERPGLVDDRYQRSL